ncbi:molybdenum cofactor sulfurase [Bisporella sp. PMI_857]|nr:molybdenum cofactor sulfurase [Bisporella sp. PMI_857]
MEAELEYNSHVKAFREEEYPMLKDAIYLDHAGATLYSKSFMEKYMADMMGNLYGNPHSGSPSSQLSTDRVEDIRLKVLRFFKADPEYFDVVFVANATAGIKLVMDAFRGRDAGFNYKYHFTAHTSLVGVRENAVSSTCLDDKDVEDWLSGGLQEKNGRLNLFAYPAQSNLDGRRLPMSWARRAHNLDNTYSLLDASAFVSTSQLDLSEASEAPDFTVLSFYKIFGFPDLGALIVRKESGTILQERKYFGGGTVDVVLCIKEQWHAPKTQSLHDSLEDGTLAFHSIISLDAAIETQKKLYGSMDQIAKHTTQLAHRLYNGLASLKHSNSKPVCKLHSKVPSSGSKFPNQGPVVAFNLRNSHGAWISNTEFEKLAYVRNFHIRTGGLCNPGGIASSLNLQAWEMKRNFSAGFRCGVESDIFAGKPTGMIRASLGAMSTIGDVDAFISFIEEFYAEAETLTYASNDALPTEIQADMVVESLTIYPIKSCGGMSVPPKTPWEVRPEGLAWDREWCLIHQGTGQALSQKRYPRMAQIRPTLNFSKGAMEIHYTGKPLAGLPDKISVPLSANPNLFQEADATRFLSSRVCGDAIVTRTYADHAVNEFFSNILEVPCALARFPAGGSGLGLRHAKAHMQKHQRLKKESPSICPAPEGSPFTPPDSDSESQKRPILLSNESPILVINRSSIDTLNKEIKKSAGKPASATVFRANIVLASFNPSQPLQPYAEDHWSSIQIGKQKFEMLGSCRRCHMICVDQDTAEKDNEPFVTLAKTRRFDSKIFFGSHMCHIPLKGLTEASQYPTISVGDLVTAES